MENKQTAVQYLRSEIKDKDNGEIPKWVYKFIDDAILKEKQQIIDAHFEGWGDAYDYLKDETSEARQAEDYYNETYSK